MVYPTGREISYSYDDLSRTIGVNGVMSGESAKQYVSSVSYLAHGAVGEMRLNGYRLRESYVHSPDRLQMQELKVDQCVDNSVSCGTPNELLFLKYGYGAQNNGNPREQQIRSSGMDAKQVYGYDSWNRLTTFTEGPTLGSTVISNTYCYDRHGNRAAVTSQDLGTMTPQVSSCNEPNVLSLFPKNRVSGSLYDAGGQMRDDGRSELRFDIEERLRSSKPLSGATTYYEYDGEGRRVKKLTGSAATVFVYDAAGQLAVDYGGVLETAGTSYLHADQLGSTRLVTDGVTAVKRLDYYPFGGELTSGLTSYQTVGGGFGSGVTPGQRFTGKERDGETGLDYFGARYMSAAQGRFITPDVSMITQPSNPQTWNKYSYVNNRATGFIDPDGNWPKEIHDKITERAFPGLSIRQLQALKNGSELADTAYPLNSAMHHTREAGQTGRQAKQQFYSFLKKSRTTARKTQGLAGNDKVLDLDKLKPRALFEFGFAMHALQDSVAPPHSDEEGNPAEYVFELGPMLEHSRRESTITETQMDYSVGLTRFLFGLFFGEEAAAKASKEKVSKACVGVSDSASGSSSQVCK